LQPDSPSLHGVIGFKPGKFIQGWYNAYQQIRRALSKYVMKLSGTLILKEELLRAHFSPAELEFREIVIQALGERTADGKQT
jgi:hypothetical protein